MAWEGQLVTQLELTSEIAQTIEVITPGKVEHIALPAGQTITKHNL